MLLRSRLFLSLCAVLLAMSGTSQSQRASGDRVRFARHPLPNQYIVVLENDAEPNIVLADAEVRHGGRGTHLFRHATKGFSITLTQAGAAQLSRDPRVRYVEEDSLVVLTQASVPWGLDRIDQRLRPLDGVYNFGALGGGVTVHVIDTGIRPTHQDFGGRAFIAADYVDDNGDENPQNTGNDDGDPTKPDGIDCHGHGTHVAGTIGGATYGVAKAVTLMAHRVLDCSGVGKTSDVIAAVDAITATVERPAVANMSLAGGPSDALDEAVRRSIESGVTYVVAAGNSNAPAGNQSPARIAEAITVAASDELDNRASFSNYGTLVDLFAPGVNIASAWRTGDAAFEVLSGTSMAAPHVAGVAALMLGEQPTLTPQQVQSAMLAAATPNVVTNGGVGSPNRLLHSDLTHSSAPSVTLLRPIDGERVLSNVPYTMTWDAFDPDGLQAFDVLLSTNGGQSFQPIAGCTAIPAGQHECSWPTPSPVTTAAWIRVVARDLTGDEAFGQSIAPFSIVIRPELVVTQVTNPPALLPPGSSFSINDIVANNGNTDAPTTTARYYVSIDATKSADDLRLSGIRVVPPLAANHQSAGTTALALPSTMASGMYTFYACADDTLAVTEVNETNNCTAAATLIHVERPDLIETALYGATSAAPGASFSVSGTVKNQGAAIAAASTTRFYLSTTPAKTSEAILLSGTRPVTALSPGATLTGTKSITVPTTAAPGTYYLLSCADDVLKVSETDETNNCVASTANILIAKPNLVTTALGNLPPAAAPGASFYATTSINNPNQVAAGASTERFYLSADAARGNDLLLSGTRSIPALAPGATSTASTKITVPNPAALGMFYVLACADDLLKVQESDESNCLASSAPVLIARSDLALTSVGSPPSAAAPGISFVVSDTVQNQSPAPAVASTGRYYLSLDGIKDSSDLLLGGNVSAPSLASNAMSTASRTLTAPVATPLGTYHLIGCVDDPGKIVEADESNNCRTAATTVLITWPDMTTIHLTAPPPTVQPGGSFEIADTVQNQGGYRAGNSTSRYYLSLDTIKDVTDIMFAAVRTLGKLEVGQTSVGTKILTVPSATPPGRYVVIACADDLGQLAELDNTNNCSPSAEFEVPPPGSP